MALQQEVWAKDIQDNFYQNNEFLQKSTDHSMWVNFKTVHIPQAGSASSVEQNRAILPASIGSRTDTELTYNLNEYSIDPILLTNLEEIQISYNKRASVLYNIVEALKYTVATQTLYSWAPSGASRIVPTTGSTSTQNLPHSTATGSRKMITIADLTSAKNKLDADNVPQMGRVLLIPSYMYNIDLLNISGINQAYGFGSPVLPNGVVARVMGFDIYIRPDVLVYDNTGTPVIKAINGDGTLTSAAATDQGAAIAYHPAFVATAMGAIKMFYRENDPVYYGNVLSGLLMHGAAKMRTDQKGVVAIVQGT
jgi:hypothetical protein